MTSSLNILSISCTMNDQELRVVWLEQEMNKTALNLIHLLKYVNSFMEHESWSNVLGGMFGICLEINVGFAHFEKYGMLSLDLFANQQAIETDLCMQYLIVDADKKCWDWKPVKPGWFHLLTKFSIAAIAKLWQCRVGFWHTWCGLAWRRDYGDLKLRKHPYGVFWQELRACTGSKKYEVLLGALSTHISTCYIIHPFQSQDVVLHIRSLIMLAIIYIPVRL